MTTRTDPGTGRVASSKDWTAATRVPPTLGRRARWAGTGALLAAATALAVGCGDFGRRYWTPTPEQRSAAERIAKFHVFTNLSDQAGPGALTKVTLGPDGLPRDYPIAFTIGGTPYARYRTRFWGGIVRGRRLVHVEYFDPAAIPDWERRDEPAAEFPAFFRVSVDVAAARTVADSRSGGAR
ncbi:MAG: hypothetical protein N2652_02580 [Kiritimatiellae bacterium]|nr:hypothetical protein [Kiritimatiellia bacterium]